jgi:hypothetical protein
MKPRRLWKPVLAISLVALFALALASPSQALESRSGDRVVIEAGEVIGDDFDAVSFKNTGYV